MSYLEYILLIIVVIAFYESLELESRVYSILSLMVGTIVLGLYYMLINSTIIGIFHLIVYSGLISVLFLSTSFTSDEYIEQEKKDYE